MTLQLRSHSRQPSQELLDLIREVGRIGTRLSEIFEAMKQKAHDEGFTDDELKDMLRTHLKGALTRGQIKWYLYEKDKWNLRKRLAGTSHVEGNKVLEQDAKSIQLRSRTKAQDVLETTTVELDREKEEQENERIRDLKATIEAQTQYIDKLENIIQERQEIQRSTGQLRIRISVSQLYREILLMRNTNTIYTNILIDNDKYVKLEAI